MKPRHQSCTDKRRAARHPRQIPCDIWLRGTLHSGIVKDVSRGGLFVQTAAKAPLGTAITLVFAPGQGRTEIRMTGCVVRNDGIGTHSPGDNAIGVGVEVIEPGALGRLISDLRLTMSESEPADR